MIDVLAGVGLGPHETQEVEMFLRLLVRWGDVPRYVFPLALLKTETRPRLCAAFQRGCENVRAWRDFWRGRRWPGVRPEANDEERKDARFLLESVPAEDFNLFLLGLLKSLNPDGSETQMFALEVTSGREEHQGSLQHARRHRQGRTRRGEQPAMSVAIEPTDRFSRDEFLSLFDLLGFGQDASHKRVLGHEGIVLLGGIGFRIRVALLRHLDGGLAEVFSECLAAVRVQGAMRGEMTEEEEARAKCVDDARFWVGAYERLCADPADCMLNNAKAWLEEIEEKEGRTAVAVA